MKVLPVRSVRGLIITGFTLKTSFNANAVVLESVLQKFKIVSEKKHQDYQDEFCYKLS